MSSFNGLEVDQYDDLVAGEYEDESEDESSDNEGGEGGE